MRRRERDISRIGKDIEEKVICRQREKLESQNHSKRMLRASGH